MPRYSPVALIAEFWSSRAFVPGACACAYIIASLLIVVMNKEILDAYQFPSTSVVLASQLAATLACIARRGAELLARRTAAASRGAARGGEAAQREGAAGRGRRW